MLFNVNEWHKVKTDIRNVFKKGDIVQITKREKNKKDTFVTVRDRNGNTAKSVSVKKLYKKIL